MSPAQYVENVAGHALVGCGQAVASGAKCGPSALAGAVTSAAGPVINGQGFVVGLVTNAPLGGGAAVLGGGKFENGAITGAFGYLFNDMMEHGSGCTMCHGDGPGANYSSWGPLPPTQAFQLMVGVLTLPMAIILAPVAAGEDLLFSQITASPLFSAEGRLVASPSRQWRLNYGQVAWRPAL
jgi:hypothetical protein